MSLLVLGSSRTRLTIQICETNSTIGNCLASPAERLTIGVGANETRTFGLFVSGRGTVPFDPATNRIFVRFRDSGGVTRGSTSVAVRTQ